MLAKVCLIFLIAAITEICFVSSSINCYGLTCPYGTTKCRKFSQSTGRGYMSEHIYCINGNDEILDDSSRTKRNPKPNTVFHCDAYEKLDFCDPCRSRGQIQYPNALPVNENADGAIYRHADSSGQGEGVSTSSKSKSDDFNAEDFI